MQHSIVYKKKLERTIRLDAEYYNPSYLEISNIIKQKSFMPLTSLCNISDGNHLKIAESFLKEGDIPYFRGQDINNGFFIENSTPVYIPEVLYNANCMIRSYFKEDDVLMSIVGTVGSIALVTNNFDRSTGSCKLAILRSQGINPYYLSAFLLSKYGQLQIQRNTRGAVQTGLILEDMDQIFIHKSKDEKYIVVIANLIKKAISENRNSKLKYKDAEELLLKELGLENWKPNQQLSYSKKFSDVNEAQRIDAEYYQPKYDTIESAIKSYSKGYIKLNTVLQYIFTGEYSEEYKTEEEGLKFYIRSTNMQNGQVCVDKDYYVDPTKFSKAVSLGDIITARVGTIGVFAEVEQNLDKAICSDNVICFRLPQSYRSDVYTLLLNSMPFFELVNRFARGSVQQRLNQETLKDLILPVLEDKFQQKLSEMIQQSFRLRHQSEILLENAKKAVELAIEEGELAALKWLKEE